MKRGMATFTLDYGTCPPWLFQRMVRLGREMIEVLVSEYGPDEFVKRIADPVWFQTFGTVLAFDWNASGLTTVLTGALKEAIRGQEKDLGIFICGGKGRTSKKTPDQIIEWGERLNLTSLAVETLVRNSKLSAKVDSSLVQDDYQLYHHAFFFSKNGAWSVVQQGMNTKNKSARRYHWYDMLEIKNRRATGRNREIEFVKDPHQGIASQKFYSNVLNLAASKSEDTQNTSVRLVQEGYKQVKKDFELLRRFKSKTSQVIALRHASDEYVAAEFSREDFKNHEVEVESFSENKYLNKILQRLDELKPKTYEELIETKGVGPKTVRALSLVSEVIYGAPPSFVDPARYAFAHGGKDAIPYPVDTKTYDQSIDIMSNAILKSRLSGNEKDKMLSNISGR